MRTSILLTCTLLFCVGMALPNTVIGQTDIVISAETVRDFGELSEENVELVDDEDASNGLAFQFTGGDNIPAVAEPTAWFKVEFFAEAAEYFIWVRAKSDGDTSTDSLWVQFDSQIGTLETTADKDAPDRGLGNWRDVFDAEIYVWASQDVPPPTVISVKFKKEGLHTILLQPRQVPHFIDQVLLSQDQDERPDEEPWEWDPTIDPREEPDPYQAADPQGKLTTSWGKLKNVR